MISCRNLTRRFGEFAAVDGVTFEVKPGTICCLLGPNGAGKSTIIKMLVGLMPPTAGEVTVAGLNVRSQTLAVKRACGVLPENLGLFDALTVQEHLELSGPIYGLSLKETRARADQLLRVLALEHGRDTFLGECSHGMRKKTSLAMALLHNPRVLLLDEPFEGIDPVTAHSISDLLRMLASRGAAILISAHILAIVDRLADQILMLRQGRIVWDSPAADLPRALEDHYFELVEAPRMEELPWLGSWQS